MNKIKETLTIKKDDSIFTKLTKWSVWMSFIFLCIFFALLWIIFFLLFSIFASVYQIFYNLHLHHKNTKQHKIAKRVVDDDYAL